MEKAAGQRHALLANVMTAVDAPGKAGDMLIFDVYTAHHSFANRSAEERRVLLYTYSPAAEGDTYSQYLVRQPLHLVSTLFRAFELKYRNSEISKSAETLRDELASI